MHKCPKCNHRVDPNNPICPNCGERLFEQKGVKYIFLYNFTLLVVLAILMAFCYGIITVVDITFAVQYGYAAKPLDYVSLGFHSFFFVICLGLIAYCIFTRKEKKELSLGLLILITSLDLVFISVCMCIKRYDVWLIVFRFVIAILGIVTTVLTFFKDKYLSAKKVLVITYGILLCFSVFPLTIRPADISYTSDLYSLSRSIIADLGIGFILYGAFYYRKRLVFASTAIKVENPSDILDDNFSNNNFDEVYMDLLKLKDLYDRKIITDEEYEEKRKELLSRLNK